MPARNTLALPPPCRFGILNGMTHAEPSTPNNSPKAIRRWFQYSLRTLLILTTVCAIAFAWLGWWSHQVRQQREAVKMVRTAGGNVEYDSYRGPRWVIDLLGADYCCNVVRVRFGYNFRRQRPEDRVTDDALRQLQSLSSLNYVQLPNATNEEVARLKQALPGCRIETAISYTVP